MLKRPHYIALGVVVLVTILVLKLPTRAAVNLKSAASGFFLPLFGAAGSVESLAVKSSYAALPRAELIRQVQQLQKEKHESQVRLMQADEALRENGRLRQQLG